MIDTHCHIDQYKNPLKIIKDCEKAGIITIGMTNLPSHFEMGYPYVLQFKKVRLALGMHPLYAELHEKEFNGFVKNLPRTSYIGEIGLDFSREGLATKDIQLESIRKILKELAGQKKILSLHSRKAEEVLLELLRSNNIQNAIFHWYSGPISLIEDIVRAGYYFSVNTAMIKSKAGQEVLKKIPTSQILTESDGPFIEIDGRPAMPSDLGIVTDYIASLWNMSHSNVDEILNNNFKRLIATLK